MCLDIPLHSRCIQLLVATFGRGSPIHTSTVLVLALYLRVRVPVLPFLPAVFVRARKPQTQRTVPVRRRRPAREPATYFQLNVLHYSSGETVLAKAWVRKMRSREPEVRIDIDAMNLIANIQAQTYYSNAIEAHLLNKPHPGLRTEPTPAV